MPGTAKAGGRFALAVLNTEEQLRIEWRRCQPGEPRARITQAIGPEETSARQRGIYESPRMRMCRIVPAEFSEVLAAADLKVSRQRHRFQVSLFQFHVGL